MPHSAPVIHTRDIFENANQGSPLTSARTRQRSESIVIERFAETDKLTAKGSNYHVWKEHQKRALGSEGLFDLVNGIEIKPDEQDGLLVIERWRRRDFRAQCQLALNMDMNLYGEFGVGEDESASSLWREINARFECTLLLAQVFADARLRAKRMQAGESMEDHINDMRKLKVEFCNAGGKLEDVEWLRIVMASLQKHPE